MSIFEFTRNTDAIDPIVDNFLNSLELDIEKLNITDLDLDFLRHPTTSDVVVKSGDDAIKRSIRNLIFTNYYERPFKSFIGSNVTALLFDNVDLMTATQIEDAIQQLINNFEPRVQLLKVTVIADIENHGFNVEIRYAILNTSTPDTPSTFKLFLERIR